MNKFLPVLALVAIFALSACGPRQFVKGKYDDNVEDTNLLTDKWSETDMQHAVKELVTSAVAHPTISNAKRPPIVMVTRLQNKTSEHIDTQSITDMFTVVVGLSVAAIPEGLPAVLTITLAIGVHAMARRNAIVRRLPAIETLGSVSVICTDKTGTLTRNEMSVVSVAGVEGTYEVEDSGYAPEGGIALAGSAVRPSEHRVLAGIARAGTLCNDASLRDNQGDWTVEGDPMEGALLAYAGKAGVDWRQARAGSTRTDAIPFDSGHPPPHGFNESSGVSGVAARVSFPAASTNSDIE